MAGREKERSWVVEGVPGDLVREMEVVEGGKMRVQARLVLRLEEGAERARVAREGRRRLVSFIFGDRFALVVVVVCLVGQGAFYLFGGWLLVS